MAKTNYLKKYGLNTLTIIAIISLLWLGLTSDGMQFSKNLMESSPALFYWGLGAFYLSTFVAWVGMQVKRWK